jgi:hypothetical protein
MNEPIQNGIAFEKKKAQIPDQICLASELHILFTQ